MVWLCAGVCPGFFRNRQPDVIRKRKGIAVFLDVSGSVNDHLPELIGILDNEFERAVILTGGNILRQFGNAIKIGKGIG